MFTTSKYEENPFYTNNDEYTKFTINNAINYEKNYKMPIRTDINSIRYTKSDNLSFHLDSSKPIVIIAPPASGKTTFLNKNNVPNLVDLDWLYQSIMKDRGYYVNQHRFEWDKVYFNTISSIALEIVENVIFDSNQQNFYIGYFPPKILQQWKNKVNLFFVITEENEHKEYITERVVKLVNNLMNTENEDTERDFDFTILNEKQMLLDHRKKLIEFISSIPDTSFNTITEGVNLAQNYFLKIVNYNKFICLRELKNKSTVDFFLTAKYMFENIGFFVYVKIENNKPSFSMFINEIKSLSDDCRLITKTNKFHIFQLMTYRDQLIEMYEYLCKNYRIPDTNIVQNIGDFPCIRRDNNHPYKNRYKTKYGLKPLPKEWKNKHEYLQVFSYCGSDKYLDKLVPTPDVIDFINRTKMYKTVSFYSDWDTKKQTAVFRGSLNRCTSVKDARLQSYILSQKHPEEIDSKIVGFSKHPLLFTKNNRDSIFRFKIPLLENDGDNDNTHFMSLFDQTKYKYILHIDGFVAAWRMVYFLHSGSVILKVDSKWKEYYYDNLKPWIHYIPVKSDLSDLLHKINWCRLNDNKCRDIANNAKSFAESFFTKKNIYNYLANIVRSNIL